MAVRVPLAGVLDAGQGRCTQGVQVPGTYRRGTHHPGVPTGYPPRVHPSVQPCPAIRPPWIHAGLHVKPSILTIRGTSLDRGISVIIGHLVVTVSVQVAETHGLAVPCRTMSVIGVYPSILVNPWLDVLQSLELWTQIYQNGQYTVIYRYSTILDHRWRQLHATSNELQLRNLTVWYSSDTYLRLA